MKTKPTTPATAATTENSSNIVMPRPLHMTEAVHARMAYNLPKIAQKFSCYVVRILAAYDIGPQSEQRKQVAAKALTAIEAVNALIAAMENISRAEYPNAEWREDWTSKTDENDQMTVRLYHRAEGDSHRLPTLQRMVLAALRDSEFWTEKTTSDGKTIRGLTCPACGDQNATGWAGGPLAITCTNNEECQATTRTLELFPLLRQDLREIWWKKK